MVVMDLAQVMFEFMNILEVPGLSWVVILMGKLQMISILRISVSLDSDGDRVAIGAVSE